MAVSEPARYRSLALHVESSGTMPLPGCTRLLPDVEAGLLLLVLDR